MKKVIILGKSGNTPDLIDVISLTDGMECVGILDDQVESHGSMVSGVPILGSIDSASGYRDRYFVSGIHGLSFHKSRDAILDRAGCPPDRWVSLIHPSAVISPSARIGTGSVVLANVTVCANAEIGNHCIVLPNSAVNHDVVVNDYVSIASSVSVAGYVTIGRLCYIGAGAVVRERLQIGEKAMVAMGAIVVKDVPPDTVVMGCPARPVEKKDKSAC